MSTDFDILAQFEQALSSSPDMTPPVVAIKILVELVAQSKASTTSEMSSLIAKARVILTSNHKYSIPASAGCTLFNQFFKKVFAKEQNFEKTKQILVTRGLEFVDSIQSFREKIAIIGSPFIQDDAVVLVHSYSRVVMRLLQHAASENKRFLVYVTESRPSDSGARAVQSLRKRGIPAYQVLDSAVAYIMEKVDLVLVGAEGVVETGGIVNHIGTYQIAIVAKEKKVPFYAVTETYKFVRMFPLDQYDLGIDPKVPDRMEIQDSFSSETPWLLQQPTLDYTPPHYITLLFTDKGVLTPSAVSDELIKVFNS